MIIWRSPVDVQRAEGEMPARGVKGPHQGSEGGGLIRVAVSGGSSGGKCTSLLLDKPEAGEKETVVYVEGEDILSRFDLQGASVDVQDGTIVLTFPDGAVLEIVGLEDITVLGDIEPAAGEEQQTKGLANNGHGTAQFVAGSLGGDGDGDGLGSLGALSYTELETGTRLFVVGKQEFLLPPLAPPAPELGSVVSVFASVAAPAEANPIAGEDDPDTTISFLVNLSQPSDLPVVVNFTVVPGSAQPEDPQNGDGDFSGPLTGTLTFAPGETVKTITLNIVDDLTFEPAETFTVQLTSPLNATLGNAGQGVGIAVGTIVDNDPVPTVQTLSGTATAIEGDAVTFFLSLSNPSFETIVVALDTVAGTAIEGVDFEALDGIAATFLPGETTTQVTVSLIEDNVFEGEESVTLSLDPESGQAGAGGQITVTIVDGNAAPTLSIASTSGTEGDALAFNLTLSGPSANTIVVSLDSSGGSATEGADFGALSGALVTFLPGVTSATASVSTIEDGIFEGSETLSVTATVVSGLPGGSEAATGTIIDDETPPKVTISDTKVSEGDTASFAVSLSGPSHEDIVLTFTTKDGSARDGVGENGVGTPDYIAKSGTVTILAGQTSATVNIATSDDNVFESSEAFTVELAAQAGEIATSGNDLVGTGTILDDDDAPSVSIGDATVVEGGTASFTVSLSRASVENVVLTFATADGSAKDGVGESGVGIPDYVAQTGSVTILAGQTSATITVPTTNNDVFEASETFAIALTPQSGTIAASGNDLEATGTIVDNESAPKVSINNVTVTEGNAASFTVKLSGKSDQDIVLSFETKDGTAKDGAGESGSGIPDYTAQTGTVTIVAGQTAATVVVATTNDGLFEPTETFAVELAPQSGDIANSDNDLLGVGTIQDNDPPPVLSIGNATAQEGEILTFSLTLSGSSLATIVISLQTDDINATESPADDADYQSLDTPNPTFVTFLPGETAKTVNVTTFEDSILEPPDLFELSATLVSGSANVSDSGRGTISNDDSKPLEENTLSAFSLFDAGSGDNADDQTDVLEIAEGAEALTAALASGQPPAADFKQVVDLNAIDDLDARIENVEVLLLTEESPADAGRGTELRLDALDVIEITDPAGTEAVLDILGNAGDAVTLLGGGWSGPIADGGFHTFSQTFGGTLVTVRIEDDIALGDVKTG